MADNGVIEAYLTALQRRLGRDPRTADRLAEIDDHLRERAEIHCRQGLEPAAAAERAICEFGTPVEVARKFEREVGGLPSKWTRWAGILGLAGVFLTTVSAANLWYMTASPGFHPRAVPVQFVASMGGEVLVAPFLVGLAQRWASGRMRRRLHLLVSGSAIGMALLWVVSTFVFWRHPERYARIPPVYTVVSSVLSITLLVGATLLLRPWSPRSGFGGQLARAVLVFGLAATVGLTAADFLVPTTFWVDHRAMTIGAHWLPTVIRTVGIAMLGVGLIRERRREPVLT